LLKLESKRNMPGLYEKFIGERFIGVKTVESPFTAAIRHLELKRRREKAIRIWDEATQALHRNPNIMTHLQEMQAGRAVNGYDHAVGKGPGIQRRVTVLGRITPIPWTQARRPLPSGGELVSQRV